MLYFVIINLQDIPCHRVIVLENLSRNQLSISLYIKQEVVQHYSWFSLWYCPKKFVSRFDFLGFVYMVDPHKHFILP